MNKKAKLTIFMFLLMTLIAGAGFVFAQTTSQQLGQAASKFFTILLGFTSVLAAITIGFGAIYYLVSLGRGSFTDEGKEWIKAGITGLLLTLSTWLIVNTIYPGLVNFGIEQLIGNNLKKGGDPNDGNPLGPKTANYNEIPIGILTENVLIGKTNCYDFDQNGDPIAGEKITDDNNKTFSGPTYMNHDRVDCYEKLAEAAEKKALLAEDLAKKIRDLMKQCSCALYGHCKDDCNKDGNGCIAGGDGCIGGACLDPKTAGCSLPDGLSNSLLNSPTGDASLSCCPDGVRDQIRGFMKTHGDKAAPPINISITKECYTAPNSPFTVPPDPQGSSTGSSGNSSGNSSSTPPAGGGLCAGGAYKNYYGLDEFYTTKTEDSIANDIEKKTQVDKKDVTYIDLDDCPTCIGDCNGNCSPNDKNCLDQQSTCQQALTKCINEDRPKCLAQQPWGKLNLIEQSMYLNYKLKQLKDLVKKDVDALGRGQSQLVSCPLARSYIDLRQINEQSDPTIDLIEITKTPSATGSGGSIEIGKYCNGFNYGNSQCYGSCTDMCPIQKDDVDCYNGCVGNNNCQEPSSGGTSSTQYQDYQKCLENRKKCTDNCYSKRKCIYNTDVGDFKTCLKTCNTRCQDMCTVRYLPCSEEYQLCQAACGHDSQCVLSNLDSCILNPESLAKCDSGGNNGNNELINSCIDGSYLCKSGSQENSGYPECLKDDTGSLFSSSYLYQNKDQQLCPVPFKIVTNSIGPGITYSDGKTCVDSNPETAKCPKASDCPNCPCDAISGSVNVSLEVKNYPAEINACRQTGQNYSNDPKCNVDTTQVKDFEITGPECNQPVFNDDPLTFYCRQDWWLDKETQRTASIGNSMTCNKAREVPVGITVDDTNTWATNWMTTAKKIINAQQELISFLDKLGNAKKYCECDSKYEASGNPVCRACCKPVAPKPIYNDKGEIIGMTPPKCIFQNCRGNSCQQMINWLTTIANYHTDIKSAALDLYNGLLADARTDILKELTYSRRTINACSASQNVNGSSKVRMLSCQRVLDDILPPETESSNKIPLANADIYHYCYGQMVGKIFSQGNLTDNWFCCEAVVPKDPNSLKDRYGSPWNAPTINSPTYDF